MKYLKIVKGPVKNMIRKILRNYLTVKLLAREKYIYEELFNSKTRLYLW